MKNGGLAAFLPHVPLASLWIAATLPPSWVRLRVVPF
jgi:hypothetical protein